MENIIETPIEMAKEQLPLCYDYLEKAEKDLKKIQKKAFKLKRKLEILDDQEKQVMNNISMCELDIETFEDILK